VTGTEALTTSEGKYNDAELFDLKRMQTRSRYGVHKELFGPTLARKKTVFLIDTSYFDGGVKRSKRLLEVVKKSLSKKIKQLRSGQKFAIIAYDQSIYTNMFRKGWRTAKASNKRLAHQWVQSLNVSLHSGFNWNQHAMYKGLKDLRKTFSDADTVHILATHLPDDCHIWKDLGILDPWQRIQRNYDTCFADSFCKGRRRTCKKTPVHTTLFNPRWRHIACNQLVRNTFKSISRQTGGTFHEANPTPRVNLKKYTVESLEHECWALS